MHMIITLIKFYEISFSLSLSILGERSGCRGNSLLCLLPALQAVHSEANSQAGTSHARPCRLSLHQRIGIHVHQVSCITCECGIIFSYFITPVPDIASLLRTCGTGLSPTWMTLRSVLNLPSSTSAAVLQAVRMYRGRLLS